MPELPEVETIRNQLTTVLPGLVIKVVEVRTPGVIEGDWKTLIGRKVKGLRRYGKMLAIDLSDGISLAIHLGMTGRLIFDPKGDIKYGWEVNYPSDSHTHVIIAFTNGSKLYYHDQRKFGWLQVVLTQKVANLPYVAKLGPEFLNNLTIQQFSSVLHSSPRPIKLVLMDQEKMAGVGNIYANESLWCAKIHPKTEANTLSDGYIATLFNCLEKILRQAIKWKGASGDAYRDAFGEKGRVQEHFQVYAREGQPCPRCKHLIRKFILGGRGTYVCPICQRL